MISIVIPAYEMHGRGVEMLRELILSIRMQTFTDYEIIVSDDGGVLRLVEEMSPAMYPNDGWPSSIFGARLVKGKVGAAPNLNNAIDCACGDIIKPMFQDDKFIEAGTLQKIADVFEAGAQWAVCKSQNGGEAGMRSDLFRPYPHSTVFRLSEGENTYGSPSAVAWRRNDLRFDEQLPWLFDCEFYGRMAEAYGVPVFVDTPVYIRQWSGMATHTIANGNQRILDRNRVIERFRAAGMDI